MRKQLTEAACPKLFPKKLRQYLTLPGHLFPFHPNRNVKVYPSNANTNVEVQPLTHPITQ